LHVAGKSKLKGTDVIIETWLKNPHFPHLTILQKNLDGTIPSAPNITYISEHISEDYLIKLMNKCEVHLCPSAAEGFGHYIGEALSCGAFVITTDAPPMNELITPTRGLLIPPVEKRKMKFSYAHYIDRKGLEKAVHEALGIENREQFMHNGLEYYHSSGDAFRKKISSEINKLVNN
jgi:glycosyltransferase involved in cell wall biosynthesis